MPDPQPAPQRQYSRGDVLTAGEVEAMLLLNIDDMNTQSDYIEHMHNTKTDARGEAELKYAKSFLVVKGTMPEKREKAKKEIHQLAKDAEYADAAYDAAKRRFSIMQQAQDTMRTIAANIRGQT
jgi:dTDP-glucose pyrophosphorylase